MTKKQTKTFSEELREIVGKEVTCSYVENEGKDGYSRERQLAYISHLHNADALKRAERAVEQKRLSEKGLGATTGGKHYNQAIANIIQALREEFDAGEGERGKENE